MRFRNWLLKILMNDQWKGQMGVIFISKFARSVIVDQCKLPIEKETTIYHGVGENFNRSSVVSPTSKYGTDYIVYPSIIDVYKSQKEVVAAYKILIEKVGPRCPPLYLVGEALWQICHRS